jgi:hypothetical protein
MVWVTGGYWDWGIALPGHIADMLVDRVTRAAVELVL